MRRRNLLTGSCALAVPLTGCLNGLTGKGEEVHLILRNYTSQPQLLQVELLKPEGNNETDAEVMRREFEVPPPAGDEPAGVTRKPDVAPHGRYLVRVLLKSGRGDWDHYHFVPSTSEAGQIDIGIYRDDASGDLYTRFLSGQ